MSLIKRTRDSRSRQERERDREMMEVGRLVFLQGPHDSRFL